MQKRAQPKPKTKSTEDKVLSEAGLNDVFDNIYRKRKTIYAVNFVRGVFFGIGSALGGTLVIAIILWILSWFINWPLVNDFINVLNSR